MSIEPIRVGIIGVHPEKGWAAGAHVPALRALTSCRIEAVSHHRADLARASSEKFDVPKFFTSSEDLVQDERVELVVVTVRVPQHRTLVAQAVAAGKAVFSEWPLGVDLREALSLRDLARASGVATSIGLQTRASPAFSYARDLVLDGYLGELLSVTVVGSGIIWGEAMSESFEYTLDRRNGASMLDVPFAHTIDALLYVLGAEFGEMVVMLNNSRRSVRITETGTDRPLTVPDQIIFGGKLLQGASVAVHFRGGLARGTNFRIEMNGSRGDLVITSPVGYVGIGGTTLAGAQKADPIRELDIPAAYELHAGLGFPARNIAIQYDRLASDLRTGTRLCPTFEDAIGLHRLLARIEASAGPETPFLSGIAATSTGNRVP